MQIRAVLYLRLSATADDSTSIARQETDLRELAQREGWDVVRVLADDGISGRKVRANVAEAFRMLTAGEAEVLAVWKLDRLTRQGLGAVGELVSTLDSVPGALFVALRDGLRSDQPAWRIIAAVLSEVARTEAENTSTRAKSAIAYRKTVTHRFTGGGTIPFGYRSEPAPDGPGRVLVVNDEEAAVVREVAGRLLEGEALATVASDLTGRGVPTSKSAFRRAAYRRLPTNDADRGRWTVSTVRTLWTASTLLGRVPLGDDVVRDSDGLPVTVWPPLVELATLERIRARFGDRDPDRRPARRAARLLSGMAFCAHCGRRLYVTTSGGRAIYGCPASRNGIDCPSPRIDAALLEGFVVDDTLRLDGDKPHAETIDVVSGQEAAGALREVEAALREATAAMMDDDADTAALLARVAALKERRAELRLVEPTVERVERWSGLTIREHFATLTDDAARRAKLLEHFDHVTVSAQDPMLRRGDAAARVRFVRGDAV